MLPARLIFITGTDTGVGKTLLTALLLAHLRQRGIRTLALKPFCSGSRSDVTLLRSVMDHELTLDEINPFYFPEPLAPLVAARKHRRHISLRQVLSHISHITHPPSISSVKESPPSVGLAKEGHAPALRRLGERGPRSTLSRSNAPTLLIEGAGGLLAPLAHDCTALDIIRQLNCEVLVVAPNKLGSINHTLMTIRALQTGHLPSAICHLPSTRIVLMNCRSSDPSAASNPRILSELLAPIPVHTFPFLGPAPCRPGAIRRQATALQRKLAALCREHWHRRAP